MQFIPEILAPAGDEKMLNAAVFASANAVYLGLKSLSARSGAPNFTIDQLKNATGFCRARGVKVYVAINTLLQEAQLKEAAELIYKACSLSVDAIITQDLAAAALVRSICPEMPLHASTQMSVHNVNGAKMLAEMGFARAILARELSKNEIAKISLVESIQTEVFIHGSHCFALSGQCYMSSFFGGRSGNKGDCAASCRLPFCAGGKSLAKEQHHLSLKELSLLDNLVELANIGVKSFKIEGRLRSPEYVSAVVTAARAVLNGKEYDRELVHQIFSRDGFTSAYYNGKINGEMYGARHKDDGAISRGAAPQTREFYRREYAHNKVDISLKLTQSLLYMKAECNGEIAEKALQISTEPTTKSQSEPISKAISKTGGTPFYVGNISKELLEGVFVKSSIVSSLRAELLEQLLCSLAIAKDKKTIQPEIPPLKAIKRAVKGLSIRVSLPEQLQLLEVNDFENIILPVEYAQNIQFAENILLELPRAVFSGEERLASLIERVKRSGFNSFLVSNLGHFPLVVGSRAFADFGLNITNSIAAAEYEKIGLTGITAAIELPFSQLCYLNTKAELTAICYGHLPLMLTRACPLHNIHRCESCGGEGKELTDRKGNKLAIICSSEYREILNPIPLYMGDRKDEISADICELYFTTESKERVAQVVEMFKNWLPYDGNYTRGIK